MSKQTEMPLGDVRKTVTKQTKVQPEVKLPKTWAALVVGWLDELDNHNQLRIATN